MAQHRSKEEWNKLLAAYENRTGTQLDFCEDNGISVASLAYHLRKSTGNPTVEAQMVELKPPSLGTPLDLLELNCNLPEIGSIMIRTGIQSLSEIITQLKNQTK